MMQMQTPGVFNWTGSDTACLEFVTPSPHGLKTGQTVYLTGTSPIVLSNGTTATTLWGNLNLYSFVAYVTGSHTFVIAGGFASYGTGTPFPAGLNVVPGEFPVNYSGWVGIPDGECISYQSAAQISGSLPGCDLWCNIPPAATDSCVRSIAQRVRDNFPKGRQVWIEYVNEHWNFQNYIPGLIAILGNLCVWNREPLSADAAYAVRAGQIRDLFVEVFNEEDITATRIAEARSNCYSGRKARAVP